MKTSRKALGAGIAAATAAGAAVYFMTGRRGEANRARMAAWALEMRGEVFEKLKRARQANKEAYHALVDEAGARYARLGRVSNGELHHLTGEVKGAWSHIRKQLQSHS